MLETGMTADAPEAIKKFAQDDPELVGGVGVWLATEKADVLRGKYMESYWDVDDVIAKKEEIVSGGKLSFYLKGEFGKKLFE